MEDMVRLFLSVGLEPQRARDVCTNAALSTVFKDMIFKVRALATCAGTHRHTDTQTQT
jgi:hypothetical protein